MLVIPLNHSKSVMAIETCIASLDTGGKERTANLCAFKLNFLIGQNSVRISYVHGHPRAKRSPPNLFAVFSVQKKGSAEFSTLIDNLQIRHFVYTHYIHSHCAIVHVVFWWNRNSKPVRLACSSLESITISTNAMQIFLELRSDVFMSPLVN